VQWTTDQRCMGLSDRDIGVAGKGRFCRLSAGCNRRTAHLGRVPVRLDPARQRSMVVDGSDGRVIGEGRATARRTAPGTTGNDRSMGVGPAPSNDARLRLLHPFRIPTFRRTPYLADGTDDGNGRPAAGNPALSASHRRHIAGRPRPCDRARPVRARPLRPRFGRPIDARSSRGGGSRRCLCGPGLGNHRASPVP
jgi:hypothetical protein